MTALAAAGLLSAANGALTGVGSAAPAPAAPPEKTATASVSVTCPFADPLGPRKLTVETSATLPSQAKSGTSATISKYSVQLSLPRDVALSLLPAGATSGSLQGAVQLALAVHQGERSDKIPVPLTVAPTPVPETGDVTLTATGDVPEIAINTVGSVTFDVTAPSLTLTAVPASDPAAAPDAPATPAAPPAPPIACTLDPDQQATLGTILVQPTAGPEQKAALGAAAALEDEPPPANEYTVPLGLITVFTKSTIKRLGATVVSDPALLINGFFSVDLDTGGSRVSGSAVFKPATTTFLAFGFVPVTATVEFLPEDYLNSKMIEIGGGLYTGDDNEIWLSTQLNVMGRVSGVKINGVPVDVGPDCVTAKSITLHVSGHYDPFTTGHIKDPNFTLPEFRDCGSGSQDLTKLLSGMSSGEGNEAKIDTYNLNGCTEPDHTKCPEDTLPPKQGSPAAAAKAAAKPR
ncbi:hypothetical protein AMES_1755 [Amycolatopsis mediterranei S699]|uniref:DUF6801 domain-containing protein n=2 Tax=Amycolatopsis mediterranei TaxID=33910 RepID=A0A0H3D058_AMYMU|nr:conserved hypothetical protein [Amycolatopsis mediterranei U32]AEK40285.1 hypothetical protein RAM_08975 [Amycolatopsis mediterranei S699]AGT82420.1 hypothetical protein B737_1756 [Amycolatopsis mediterranei RB]KDO03778.1 hypothetical protein DV26_47230 [Amycolatopsis mediterranei]AFO75291.1 hypothetical protein AMES_1755 [Amycolatopsis mediterranei S699]